MLARPSRSYSRGCSPGGYTRGAEARLLNIPKQRCLLRFPERHRPKEASRKRKTLNRTLQGDAWRCALRSSSLDRPDQTNTQTEDETNCVHMCGVRGYCLRRRRGLARKEELLAISKQQHGLVHE